ncbi:MAG: hypothetical protein DYG99_12755 [Bacteroidetes bacterium CHB5]|nr:hypothetical protein [Bacteroidetes bacterium CHB5]
MFLGWVMNVLYLAFVINYVPATNTRYKKLFVFLQLNLLGMMIAFPLQGYGLFSIAFSTLHTMGIALFTYWLYQDTKHQPISASLWLVRKSLLFFLLSAVGPFTLGPLMATGLAQSPWYYSAIYFYLHFQYNGVFVLGCMSLLFYYLEKRGFSFHAQTAILSFRLLVAGTILTYALSVLWTSPGVWVNSMGGIGALIQLASLYYFWKTLQPVLPQLKESLTRLSYYFLYCVWLAYLLKLLLQLLSAWPAIALLAYGNRSYIIAYLHLVLIGVVTFFLIARYMITNRLRLKKTSLTVIYVTIMIGFVVLEVVLISIPVLRHPEYLLFISSAFITAGFVALLFKK